MASIRDVAKKANVGAATVSRVLNNSGYVSEETRQKIEDAMKELNYTPNELARQLFHKKTGIVAVIVPTVGHPFFSDFVDKIEEELYKKGYKRGKCRVGLSGHVESTYCGWSYKWCTYLRRGISENKETDSCIGSIFGGRNSGSNIESYKRRTTGSGNFDKEWMQKCSTIPRSIESRFTISRKTSRV